ncbi:MAG: 2-hydroxyglutaryl-CoA dehydratase [Candidatus Cloacimonetes bacterium]|nr:2-hydroxyglutaryl-CoA dehydratase [Candidatus Cloacimonadota bacterium]
MDKIITIGIDLGSRTSKLAVIENGKHIYSLCKTTGVNPKTTAEELLAETKKNLKIKDGDIAKIYSTGYGRNIVPFSNKKISEISCHAKGVNLLFPKAKAIIDIGGQDSKGILINSKGRVLDFVMNDKCAAGTGRFLEVAANILEVTVDDLGRISLTCQNDVVINSTCVVFAESEIIGLISQGVEANEIIRSIHLSIAKRTRNLIAPLHWQQPLVFTGGVAKNRGMKKALEEVLDCEIFVPDDPFITGALGAANFAYQDATK